MDMFLLYYDYSIDRIFIHPLIGFVLIFLCSIGSWVAYSIFEIIQEPIEHKKIKTNPMRKGRMDMFLLYYDYLIWEKGFRAKVEDEII